MGNRIAYLKDETLKSAYDHYGSSADPMLVKKIANANYTRLKGELETKLKNLNSKASSFVEKENQKNPTERQKLEDIFT